MLWDARSPVFANPRANPGKEVITILSLFQDAVFVRFLLDAVPQPIWLVFQFHLFSLSSVFCLRAVQPTHDIDDDVFNIGSRKSYHHHLAPCVSISISCIPSPPELFTTDYDPPGVVAIHWLRALTLGWRLGYRVKLRVASFLPWSSQHDG